jgi:hypothetical protein
MGAPRDFHFFSLSPDEQSVAAVDVDPDGNTSMWIKTHDSK